METALQLEPDSRGVILAVRAHAGARRNAIVGVRGGMLRVAVTAAPEKGKANKAIVSLLSGALGVPKSEIVLLAGATSPRKRFLVLGRNAEALAASVRRLADGP